MQTENIQGCGLREDASEVIRSLSSVPTFFIEGHIQYIGMKQP